MAALSILGALGCDSAKHASVQAAADAQVDAQVDGGVVVPEPSKPLAGCEPKKLAVAHYADGKALGKQPAGAPFTCLTQTGKPGTDTVLAITDSGKLLFSPAGAGFSVMGLLGSTNNGMSFESLGTLPKNASVAHPWLWRDATSGRVFFTAFNGTPPLLSNNGVAECKGTGGSDLWRSDDDGKSFRRSYVGCDSRDYGKIITGPASSASRRAELKASGYPNMVYYCATGPTVLTGPNRMCYRSSDGGDSRTRTKADPITEAHGGSTWPEEGSVGDDGSIYIAHVAKSGPLAVAISHDEGDSWKDVLVAGTHYTGSTKQNWLSSSARADSEGNVYVVWVDDSDMLPHLVYSRDRGNTWSKSLLAAAPGVAHARYPNIGVSRAGYVAIAYYGSGNLKGNGNDGYFSSDGRAYDAYVAVTTDLFADEPVFWSSQVNANGKPVIPGGISFASSEYIGPPQFGPDGSIWAAFTSSTSGLAARLTAPRPAD